MGATAAHMAACKGHSAVLACLLDRGVHPGATTLDGWSLLHEAAVGGQVDAVRLLLQRGADPEVLDPQRRTPRQLAQAKGCRAVVALLPGPQEASNTAQVMRFCALLCRCPALIRVQSWEAA